MAEKENSSILEAVGDAVIGRVRGYINNKVTLGKQKIKSISEDVGKTFDNTLDYFKPKASENEQKENPALKDIEKLLALDSDFFKLQGKTFDSQTKDEHRQQYLSTPVEDLSSLIKIGERRNTIAKFRQLAAEVPEAGVGLSKLTVSLDEKKGYLEIARMLQNRMDDDPKFAMELFPVMKDMKQMGFDMPISASPNYFVLETATSKRPSR